MVAKRPVDGVDQTLSPLIERRACAHPVHGIAKGHAGFGVGKTKRAARANMAERLLREQDTVLHSGRLLAVVHGFHEAQGKPGRHDQHGVSAG